VIEGDLYIGDYKITIEYQAAAGYLGMFKDATSAVI
jgi:hypothetical protein